MPSPPLKKPTSQQVEAFLNAAASGNTATLQVMLDDFGFTIVNQRSYLGWTPLMHALQHHHMEAAALLLKHGAKIAETDENSIDAQLLEAARDMQKLGKLKAREDDKAEAEVHLQKLKKTHAPKINLQRKP